MMFSFIDQNPENEASLYYKIFTETVGFFIGFFIGGITGYFGNWLWYKFGPKKNKPHFQLTSEDGKVSFSGIMSKKNSQQILSSLDSAIKYSTPDEGVDSYNLPNDSSSTRSTASN